MSVIIWYMLLERRLVKILWNEMLASGIIYYSESFVDLVETKKWPRCNYLIFHTNDEKFKNRISFFLKDCIEYGYIKKDKETNLLSVTKSGRDFLTFGGLLEEYFKRRHR